MQPKLLHIRSNLEIQNECKSPDIVTEINVRGLEWLGHVVRMEDNPPTKTGILMLNQKADVELEDLD
jgi:hypothetical protein